MMGSNSATLTNEFLDSFPTGPSRSGGRPRTETDADVALKQLLDSPALPSPVLHFLDFNVDVEGAEVDATTARQRASARAQNLRDRGYSVAEGWVIRAIDGHLYAQYWGAGNVPDEFIRKGKVKDEASV